MHCVCCDVHISAHIDGCWPSHPHTHISHSNSHAFDVLSGNEFKGSWFLSCGFIIQYLIYGSLYSSSYFYTIFQWLSSISFYSMIALCVCVHVVCVMLPTMPMISMSGRTFRSGLNFYYYYSHRRITGRYFADWGKFIVCGKRLPTIHPLHTASYNQKKQQKRRRRSKNVRATHKSAQYTYKMERRREKIKIKMANQKGKV